MFVLKFLCIMAEVQSQISKLLLSKQLGVMRVVCSGIDDVDVHMRRVRANNYSQKQTCMKYVEISYLLHEYMVVVGLHILQLAIL
jgi:hypothetical protein